MRKLVWLGVPIAIVVAVVVFRTGKYSEVVKFLGEMERDLAVAMQSNGDPVLAAFTTNLEYFESIVEAHNGGSWPDGLADVKDELMAFQRELRPIADRQIEAPFVALDLEGFEDARDRFLEQGETEKAGIEERKRQELADSLMDPVEAERQSRDFGRRLQDALPGWRHQFRGRWF